MAGESLHDQFYLEMARRYGQLYDSYDRSVLTLSGGALALSVTFLGDLVRSNPDHMWSLRVGWALLVLSVLTITTSAILSIRSHRRILEELGDPEEKPTDIDDDLAGKWAERLSIGAGAFLGFGLGFLAWFASNNL